MKSKIETKVTVRLKLTYEELYTIRHLLSVALQVLPAPATPIERAVFDHIDGVTDEAARKI
jgi:hypothetical protein